MRGTVLQFIVENEQREEEEERKNYVKPGIRIMVLKEKKNTRIFNCCNKMAIIIKKKQIHRWFSKCDTNDVCLRLEKNAAKKNALEKSANHMELARM